MVRKTVWVALVLLVAPAAARFTASSVAAEAARCALACARAGMGAEKGAACCPTGHGPAVPSLSSCAHDADATPVPGAVGPILLVAALLLPLPSLARRLGLAPNPALPFSPSRIPDKVPLLLG